MPALTTLLAVGLGAAGTAVQVSQQKKAEKAAANAARKQEIKALEAQKLKGPEQQDLKVKLGSDGASRPNVAMSKDSSDTKGTSTADTGAAKRVGRVFGGGPRASMVGGL